MSISFPSAAEEKCESRLTSPKVDEGSSKIELVEEIDKRGSS